MAIFTKDKFSIVENLFKSNLLSSNVLFNHRCAVRNKFAMRQAR